MPQNMQMFWNRICSEVLGVCLGKNTRIHQDDNASCHRAKLVKRWMQSHGVCHLNWPAPSPNLNLIENLWHRINTVVAKKKPTSKQDVIEKIIFAWHHIVTPEELRLLVHSLPRRCLAMIKNKGYTTKY